MASTEVNQMLAAAAAACEDKKAEDIRILALDPSESGLTDYFLICSGNNDRQNVAITDEIELRLKKDFGMYPNSVEGRRQGEWVLMDYVDFIVHVFSTEKRAFYALERLRKTATVLSIENLNELIKQQIAQARGKGPRKELKAAIAAKSAPVKTKTVAVKKVVAAKKAVPAKKSIATKKKVATKKSVTKKLTKK